jgi:adenylate cyclase
MPAAGAKARILVVDDQPANLTLLADFLALAGYEVIQAASGTQALKQVGAGGLDLVLLDIVMPDVNGYEVCRHIRSQAHLAGLPVVMITALDPDQERVKGLDAGADDFLAKPVNQTELLARVRSLLRVKALHDQLREQAAALSELNATLERRVQEQVAQLQRLAQLKRFFPAALAEMIVAGTVDDPLRTRRREVTVVFLDLRGFTAFADASEPEEVIGLLSEYHAEMGSLIDEHGGTLEQFAGDSLMIVFNDPVPVPDPAKAAVRMAVRMQQRFDAMVCSWRKRGHEIALGIGIAHGYATIGRIGYEARIGYGVIGRVSNLAARLCGEAKAEQILISPPVLALVEDVVEAEEVGALQLKGFARPVTAYKVNKLR